MCLMFSAAQHIFCAVCVLLKYTYTHTALKLYHTHNRSGQAGGVNTHFDLEICQWRAGAKSRLARFYKARTNE